MIPLTKLNGSTILLNSDLIEHIAQTPDTIIVLVTGHTMRVLEDMRAIQEKIIEFRRNTGGGSRARALTAVLKRTREHAELTEEDLDCA